MCGGCPREIPPEREACLYCGWSEKKETTRTAPLEESLHHAGGTVGPFVISAVLLGGIGLLMIYYAIGFEKPAHAIAGGGLLVIGPALAAVQLVRRNFQWVRVLPEKGLELAGGRIVPWGAIGRVERYVGPLHYKHGADTFLPMFAGGWGKGGRALGCAVIPVSFLYFVFIPVIAVIWPWCSKMTVRLKTGEELVWKDLERDDEFDHALRRKVGNAAR